MSCLGGEQGGGVVDEVPDLPPPIASHLVRLSQSTGFELPVAHSKFPLATYASMPTNLESFHLICDLKETQQGQWNIICCSMDNWQI